MGNLTHTVSGDIASFRSAACVPIESLKCHFLPVQEGTGDLSPENVRPISGWQGITINKCKKNLFNFDINNVEYDVPNNKGENRSIYHTGIIGDGRKISVSAVLIDTELTSNTQINLGYLQNGTLYQTISLIVWDTGVGYSRTMSIPIGQELLLVNASNSAYAWTRNMPRYNIQIEINDINTIFEPYYDEQIPITFPVLEKNKFNWNAEFVNPDVTASTNASKRIFQSYTYCIGGSYSNYFLPNAVENYNIENGIISVKRKTGYSVYGVSYALPLIGGQTYYLSCTAVSGFIHTAFYDKEGNYLTGSSNNYSNFSFTVPDNATISVFNFIPSNTTDIATFSNIQIELGNTATEYTEFSGNNTVYGGYVDIAKGEIVATHKQQILNGTETWDMYRSKSAPGWHFYHTFNDKKVGLNGTISDTFPNANNTYFWDREDLPTRFGDHQINHNLYFNAPYQMINGVSEWKAWLAEHNVTVVYPLENPIHYPLSKTELKTFLDQNNIWSNTNDITEVSYAVHDSAMIHSTKKQIIGNEPHIETASGAIATFNTDMIAPVKSAKFYFNPIQEGSGDPSPENVRNISGWTGVQVTKTGKNMLNPSTYKDTSPYTSHDVTFVHDGNGTVSVSGTNSASGEVRVGFMWVQPFTCNYYVCSNLDVTSTYADVYIWDVTTSARVKQWDGETASLSSAKNRPIVQVQLPAGHQIRITCRVFPGKNVDGVSYKPMLLAANCTDTTFETYVGSSTNISWTSISTIYGGYVDLITGEVWKTCEKITLDGVTTNRKVNSDYSNDTYIIGGVVYLNPTGAGDYYSGYRSKLYCNKMVCIGAGDTVLNTLPFIKTIANGAQYLRIYLAYAADHTDLDTTQKRKDFCNSYLAENPIDIVYPLKTPQLVTTLTPTQLKSFIGQNNVWSNTNGNTEIKYWTH